MNWGSAKIVSYDKESLGFSQAMYSFSAFIETKSRSPKVICSVISTYEPSPSCISARAYRHGSKDGILVTVYYEGTVKSAGLTLLLMQEGADENSFQPPIPVWK